METKLADDPIPPLPGYKSEAEDEDRETPLADDATILLAKPKAMMKEDLPAAQGTSPTRLEDPVAPTATSVDKLANPSTPANSTESEGQNTQCG